MVIEESSSRTFITALSTYSALIISGDKAIVIKTVSYYTHCKKFYYITATCFNLYPQLREKAERDNKKKSKKRKQFYKTNSSRKERA